MEALQTPTAFLVFCPSRGKGSRSQQDAQCWMALVYTQCFKLTCWGSVSGASPGSTAFVFWHLEWEIERFWQILRGLLLLLKYSAKMCVLNLFCNFWDISMTWRWTGILPLVSSVWDLGNCHWSITFPVVGASLVSPTCPSSKPFCSSEWLQMHRDHLSLAPNY